MEWMSYKTPHQCTGKKPKLYDLCSDQLDESPGDRIDEMELKNSILYYKHEYKRKLALGKAVH